MSNFKKYLEISFFVFINLLLGSSIISLYFGKILFGLFSFITGINFAIQEEYDGLMILMGFLFYLLYLCAKIFLLPTLYSYQDILPETHKFYDNIFSSNRKTLLIFGVILLIIIADTILCMLILDEILSNTVFLELIFGLGLIPSYLIMLIYVKLKNRKKLKKE